MKISLKNFEVVEKEDGIYKKFSDSERLLKNLEDYINNNKEKLIKKFDRCYDDFDLLEKINEEIYHSDQEFTSENGGCHERPFSYMLTRYLYESMLNGVDEKNKDHIILTMLISERIVVQRKMSEDKRDKMWLKRLAQKNGFISFEKESIKVVGDKYVSYKDIENLNINGCLPKTMIHDIESEVSQEEAEMNCWKYVANNRKELNKLIKLMLFLD